MKKNHKTPFAIALTASVASMSANIAQAESSNPFALSELSSGYMQTAQADNDKSGTNKMKDGACGEGKCGASMMQGNQEKTVEGKCAGNKPMPANSDAKGMEGKCGEGKCGASMR